MDSMPNDYYIRWAAEYERGIKEAREKIAECDAKLKQQGLSETLRKCYEELKKFWQKCLADDTEKYKQMIRRN